MGGNATYLDLQLCPPRGKAALVPAYMDIDVAGKW
jgi:hypothetical protein